MHNKSLFVLLLAVSLISVADAEERILTGRYSEVQNVPPADQMNPLRVVINTSFPANITTVGQAMNFLLLRSGYSLANTQVLSNEAVTLLRLPLPEVHRSLGPITLDVALKALAGDAYDLVVDPVNRKIGFELSTRIVRVQ
jgi:type IV pili sensor histidine kinase/response regulator